MTVGVMAAIIILHALLNSMTTGAIEKLTRGYVIFHIGVLVSCCIVLLVLCHDKHTTSYVWTNVTPASGWTPVGFSFVFGFLSSSWTMTDYDATAHIAEEIKDPAIKAPWAITIALGFTYIGGWLFTIVLTYCAGDISAILESPLGQPVAQIFYNVIGPAGGTVFTVFAFIILNFTGMVGMQAGARTLWACARDELLPFSGFLYRINARTSTPLNSVWTLSLLSILINLIALGSYTAVAAIFNVTAIALDWSYCIPIICKMISGRFEPGPWHLGRWSFWINLYAVLWTLLASVIFVLPTVRPVTAENVSFLARGFRPCIGLYKLQSRANVRILPDELCGGDSRGHGHLLHSVLVSWRPVRSVCMSHAPTKYTLPSPSLSSTLLAPSPENPKTHKKQTDPSRPHQPLLRRPPRPRQAHRRDRRRRPRDALVAQTSCTLATPTDTLPDAPAGDPRINDATTCTSGPAPGEQDWR